MRDLNHRNERQPHPEGNFVPKMPGDDVTALIDDDRVQMPQSRDDREELVFLALRMCAGVLARAADLVSRPHLNLGMAEESPVSSGMPSRGELSHVRLLSLK